MPTTKQDDRVQQLLEMLSYKRPMGCDTEEDWLDEYVRPLKESEHVSSTFVDEAGNIWITVGKGSKTLFTSHSDTVHITQGRQVVLYDDKTQTLYKEDGAPLGADDGAGVWLLREMILAGVPGTYQITRGEERGGVGSSWAADNMDKYLGLFDRAIAFDRRATHSVITHQGGLRCCSQTFAESLCIALENDDYFYSPDDGGSFTDTKNYTNAICECTNVSIGYYNEHTGKETLDVAYLFALRDQCLAIDWEALPTERVAGSVESMYSRYDFFRGSGSSYRSMPAHWWDADLDDGYTTSLGAANDPRWDLDTQIDSFIEDQVDYQTIYKFCEDHPAYAAEIIEELLWQKVLNDSGQYADDELEG